MESKRTRSVKVSQASSNYDLFNQLLLIVIAVTVTTLPFVFDSFTSPKLLVLAVGLTYISVRMYLDNDVARVVKMPKVLSTLICLFTFSIILSWFVSDVPFTRGLIGQFGRGNGVLYYLAMIAVFAFSLKTFQNSNRLRMHKLLTLLSWFMSLYAALQFIGVDIARLDTKGISPVVLTFGNSNFAGGMLAVLFSYQLTYTVVSREHRVSQIGLLLALSISSTFTGAVQGYLIILLSNILAVTIILVRKYPSNLVRQSLKAAWFIGITSTVFGVFGKFVFAAIFERQSFQIRIEYWKIALSVLKDFPLFGIGPDKLYDISGKYMPPGSLEIVTSTRLDNAHNWYLHFGVGFGLISLTFLIAILGWVLVVSALLFRYLEPENAIALASAVAFAAMFIDGLVSLEQPGIGVWLYLFAGVVIGAYIDLSRKSTIKTPSRNSKTERANPQYKISVVSLIVVLAISSIVLGNRIIIDMILRSNVQTALVNKGTEKTFSRIESAAVKLYSEPEYAVQALKPLAERGDAAKIDVISKAFYDYYPNSIQATLIRTDVLRALNRIQESCPLRETLIENTPWDSRQLGIYVDCHIDGFVSPNLVKNLSLASKYFLKIEQGVIPEDENEVARLTEKLVEVTYRARVLFIIGQIQSAKELQRYGNALFSRLINLSSVYPSLVLQSELEQFGKLLNF